MDVEAKFDKTCNQSFFVLPVGSDARRPGDMRKCANTGTGTGLLRQVARPYLVPFHRDPRPH